MAARWDKCLTTSAKRATGPETSLNGEPQLHSVGAGGFVLLENNTDRKGAGLTQTKY
jgi:hypothetical protein